MSDQNYEFDVALSFAGEQREYVEKVADYLRQQGVKVFYDRYFSVETWGKNLPEYFQKIYTQKSGVCVIFISDDYARKMWTNMERRFAIDRAIQQSSEYILPVRFDDAVFEGWSSSVKYIDLREGGWTPEKLAQTIIEKSVDLFPEEKSMKKVIIPPSSSSNDEPSPVFDPYEAREQFINLLDNRLGILSEEFEKEEAKISIFDSGDKHCYRLQKVGNLIYALDIQKGGFTNDKGVRFSVGKKHSPSGGFNASAIFGKDEKTGKTILFFQNLSLFSSDSPTNAPFSVDYFIQRIKELFIAEMFGDISSLAISKDEKELIHLKRELERLRNYGLEVQYTSLDHPKCMSWRKELKRVFANLDVILERGDYEHEYDLIPWHPPSTVGWSEEQQKKDFEKALNLSLGLIEAAINDIKNSLQVDFL